MTYRHPQLTWEKKSDTRELDPLALQIEEWITPESITRFLKQKKQECVDPQPDFFSYTDFWSNRLLKGAPIEILNSLKKKERLKKRVQMIFINFSENQRFFIKKEDASKKKESESENSATETESLLDSSWFEFDAFLFQIQLCYDLLCESGSLFVQCSDENYHHVRELVAMVFDKGKNVERENVKESTNYIVTIPFLSFQNKDASGLAKNFGYILWYAKNSKKLTYYPLYIPRDIYQKISNYDHLKTSKGDIRSLSSEERKNPQGLLKDAKLLKLAELKTQDEKELERLQNEKRVYTTDKKKNNYIRYETDFPRESLKNVWSDLPLDRKTFPNQIPPIAFQRCMLMATDPGDLVMDPCSDDGTAAMLSEYWGRRWICCNDQANKIQAIKSKLIASCYPAFILNKPEIGPQGGFRYTQILHITRKQQKKETMVNEIEIKQGNTRITGLFSIGSISNRKVMLLEENGVSFDASNKMRIPDILDLIRTYGIKAKSNNEYSLARVELTRYPLIHALAETRDQPPRKVAIALGSRYQVLEKAALTQIIDEAKAIPGISAVIILTELINDGLLDLIKQQEKAGILVEIADLNTIVGVYKEHFKSGRIPIDDILGELDAELIPSAESKNKADSHEDVQIVIRGYDIIDFQKEEIDSQDAKQIVYVEIDTNHDGKAFIPYMRYCNKTILDKAAITVLLSPLVLTITQEFESEFRSPPFTLGSTNKIAVKVVTNNGIEVEKKLSLNAKV